MPCVESPPAPSAISTVATGSEVSQVILSPVFDGAVLLIVLSSEFNLV